MAMSYKTSEAIKYQKDFIKYVKEEVKKQNYTLEPNKTRHFYIDAVFYFDRTDRDPNNYFKCMLDAITDTGLIWIDDNVTCERVQRIYYDSSNPRIELEIYPCGYIGVFDNTSQLEQFEFVLLLLFVKYYNFVCIYYIRSSEIQIVLAEMHYQKHLCSCKDIFQVQFLDYLNRNRFFVLFHKLHCRLPILTLYL